MMTTTHDNYGDDNDTWRTIHDCIAYLIFTPFKPRFVYLKRRITSDQVNNLNTDLQKVMDFTFHKFSIGLLTFLKKSSIPL